MANMYDITGLNYYPSTNREWFAKSIFGGDLIERGKILPLENVKESTDLNLFELVGKLLQKDDRDCSWTPDQLAKLTNKTLQVITYKINKEQCLDSLESKNTVWMLKAGAKNESLPTDLEELTMERIAQQLAEEIEALIFSGDSTNPDEFDGVIKTLSASAESVKVKGVAINTSNVLAEIEKVYLATPMAVRKSGKKDGTLCIYVSDEIHELATIALAGVNGTNVVINPSFSIKDDVIKYLGVELVPALGLGESEMVSSKWTNLILGTDLVSDTQSVELKQFPFPHDGKIGIKGRLRLGFAMPFESEAVIYSPDVESSPAGRSVAPMSASTTTGGATKVYEKTATQVIALIKVAQTIEEIDALIEGDERKTVNDEANKRKAEIQASSTTTGGE